MTDARAEQIDGLVAQAGELIGHLQQEGAITPGQARLIVEAVVRAQVTNFKDWELRDSATRIAAELEGEVRENQSGNVR